MDFLGVFCFPQTMGNGSANSVGRDGERSSGGRVTSLAGSIPSGYRLYANSREFARTMHRIEEEPTYLHEPVSRGRNKTMHDALSCVGQTGRTYFVRAIGRRDFPRRCGSDVQLFLRRRGRKRECLGQMLYV